MSAKENLKTGAIFVGAAGVTFAAFCLIKVKPIEAVGNLIEFLDPWKRIDEKTVDGFLYVTLMHKGGQIGKVERFAISNHGVPHFESADKVTYWLDSNLKPINNSIEGIREFGDQEHALPPEMSEFILQVSGVLPRPTTA